MIAGGVDTTATETKGTVLIHSAEQVWFIYWIVGINFDKIGNVIEAGSICQVIIFQWTNTYNIQVGLYAKKISLQSLSS